MNTKEEQEIKKDFLLERVILFSDAVFAIIVTIMVIEIHLPEEVREFDEHHLREAFFHLIPKIGGYILSFAFIAMFWIKHLSIFSYLKDYNTKLLALNLTFLFCLSMFPFAVSLLTAGISQKLQEYAWSNNTYVLVILSCIFMQAVLVNFLVNNRHLCIGNTAMEDDLKYKVQRRAVYIIPVVGSLIICANFLNLSFFISALLMAAMGGSLGFLRKRYYPNARASSPGIISTIFNRNKKPRNVVTSGE